MVKTVIFDVDGTMYDYERGNCLGLKALEQYCMSSFHISEEQFQTIFTKASRMAAERIGYLCASIHNRIIRFQCMLELLGEPLFPHAQVMYHIYWDTLLDHMEPYPGLIDWMKTIKASGASIGVGTNMTAYIQYRKLEQLGVASLVDWIVTSEEAGVEKPDQKFFELCIRKSGQEPEACLFVGDSQEADIFGARANGMKAVLFSPGSDSSGVITSFEDCLDKNDWLFW